MQRRKGSGLARTIEAVCRGAIRHLFGPPGRRTLRSSTPGMTSPEPSTDGPGHYPGDFHGTPEMTYAPRRDDVPDPGEVVWTWVPYEEDVSQGKDRPVLLIGRDNDWLLALQLTSKDHDRDAEQERRAGREWVDIGSGAWDRNRRPSEVRVNRILRIAPGAVRREGARLDAETFNRVAAAVRARRGC